MRYLALAHNVRDKKTGMPKAEVIHNLGREDTIDKEDLAHLPNMQEGIGVHNYYRAMDFLLEAECDVQREVFFSVVNLLNL